MIATFRKELGVLWATPLPYLSGAIFHVAFGLFAVDTMQARAQATFQPLVPILGFLVLLAVPILTMRTIAEERRAGTLDVLLAIPARPLDLVVGKWVAVVVTALVVVAPAGAVVVLLRWWGDPDLGPVIAGTVGIAALVAAAAAVGLAASSAASGQASAALAASFVLLAGWFLRPSAASVALRTVTARLSLNERLRSFAAGGIDLADASYLAAITVVGLSTAVGVVALRGGRVDRRRVAALGAVAAMVVVGAQWRLDERSSLIDLTAGDSLTLTSTTRDLLGQLDARVEITAFLRSDAPARAEAISLLDRYEATAPRIRARVVDPARAPGEAQRLGADPVFGGVVIESRGERTLVPAAIEQDLTIGIARLLRGELPTVCFVRGHGELDPRSRTPTGAAALARALGANGYPIAEIDLLAGDRLDRCGPVLVLAPATDYGNRAAVLVDHLDAGGRLGIFLEPGFEAGLDPVLARLGLELRPGVVVEGDPGSMFSGDPTAPLIRRYSSASPVVRGLPPTYTVTVGGLEIVAEAPGRTIARLADTSERSVLVDESRGDAAAVTPGPVTIAAAVEEVSVTDGVRRTRAVVVADGDLVTDAFLGQAANATFAVQAVDWLAVEDDLVRLTPNLPPHRPLQLTAARRDYARLLTTVLIPGAFVVAGAAVFVVRRGR